MLFRQKNKGRLATKHSITMGFFKKKKMGFVRKISQFLQGIVLFAFNFDVELTLNGSREVLVYTAIRCASPIPS